MKSYYFWYVLFLLEVAPDSISDFLLDLVDSIALRKYGKTKGPSSKTAFRVLLQYKNDLFHEYSFFKFVSIEFYQNQLISAIFI